jgi:hypothetical protein
VSAGHPAVDVLTRRVAVVMQDRPVVGLSTWLADVIRICAVNDKGLQLVTPAGSRLTTALHTALNGPGTRWVVRHDDRGFYDGHTGRLLHWSGDAFHTTEHVDISPAFLDETPLPAWHLSLSLSVRHRPTAQLQLGTALEQLFELHTGRPPDGWGTAEPATEPWNRGVLTDFCRDRAPQRTWLAVVGQPSGRAVATLTVSRPGDHVAENIELTLVRPQPWRADDLSPTVDALARRHHIRQLFAAQSPGLTDATSAPRWSGLPTPLGLFAGPDALDGRRPEHLLDVGAHTATTYGTRDRIGNWYTLHRDGEEPAPAWARLQQVVAHLNTPWLRPRPPQPWGDPEP